MGSPQKRGAFQPIMYRTFSQTPTSNLGQEVLVSPFASSPNSSQSFLVGQDRDGIIVKGENEVIQQQSSSHKVVASIELVKHLHPLQVQEGK
jgi:hypothetical protein